MRRLPVYLLIDTSGSMSGEPIAAVENGIQTLLAKLRSDPHALETAYMSVIEFNSDAKQTVPLTDIISFQAPTLSARGTTALGEALTLAAERIKDEVVTGSATVKGDWKPLVFLFTDGSATDDYLAGINAIKSIKTGPIIACAAGVNVETDQLLKLTNSVVQLDNCSSDAIFAFFEWVSQSISVNSMRIESGQGEANDLSDFPPQPPQLNHVSLAKY